MEKEKCGISTWCVRAATTTGSRFKNYAATSDNTTAISPRTKGCCGVTFTAKQVPCSVLNLSERWNQIHGHGSGSVRKELIEARKKQVLTTAEEIKHAEKTEKEWESKGCKFMLRLGNNFILHVPENNSLISISINDVLGRTKNKAPYEDVPSNQYSLVNFLFGFTS